MVNYEGSRQNVSFNIASTGSHFENQFIQKRRANKLDLSSTKISQKKSNMINIEIDKSHLNPGSEILSPYEQIQKNQHIQELEQAEKSSLDSSSANNPLDLLKLDLTLEEQKETIDAHSIENQIKH